MFTNLGSFYKTVTGKRLLIVYHHPCADGSLAAAIVALWIRKHSETGIDATYAGHYHSKVWEDEWSHVNMDEIDLIVFLDVAPTYNDGLRLTSTLQKPMLVIDHHEGLGDDLERMVNEGMDVQVVYGDHDSGASLTWVVTQEDVYSEEWTEARFAACPPLVRIVRARDLWTFDQDPALGSPEELKGIAEALYLTTATTPEGMEHRLLQAEEGLLVELKTNAAMARNMLDIYCGKMAAEARKTSFKPGLGLDTSLAFYTVNCPHFLTSVMGEYLDKHGVNDCDFYLLWAKNEASNAYGTSLRKPVASDLDLSVLAKSMASVVGGSGGGHVRAAGHRLLPGQWWDQIIH